MDIYHHCQNHQTSQINTNNKLITKLVRDLNNLTKPTQCMIDLRSCKLKLDNFIAMLNEIIHQVIFSVKHYKQIR
jgi:hypothetical protein